MVEAANEADFDQSNRLLAATVEACDSADEWIQALRDHPEAFGLTQQLDISAGEHWIRVICSRDGGEYETESPTCADADAQGLLDQEP